MKILCIHVTQENCCQVSYNRTKIARHVPLTVLIMLFFPCYLFEESLLVKDPVFSKEDAYVLDRKHSYERALQKGLRMVELTKEHQITDPEEVNILERYLNVLLIQ